MLSQSLKITFSILLISLFGCSGSSRTITPEQFWNLKEQGALILDVRSQEEYSLGHIKDATNIPHDAITQNKKILPTHTDTLIVLYCRSGRRSKLAQTELTNLGYTNVKNAGGYNSLIQAKGN